MGTYRNLQHLPALHMGLDLCCPGRFLRIAVYPSASDALGETHMTTTVLKQASQAVWQRLSQGA